MNDHELILQITQNNDHKAFAVLVDKYQKLVVNTCRGFVNSYADAEDLAQDIFIELYESLPEFRNESKLSTWIYRIAVNKSLNYIRKRKRETFFGSIGTLFGSGDNEKNQNLINPTTINQADKDIDSKELKAELKKAINNLPENQRIAFVLNKYQDLSYKEVAEVMEISLSSVESLIFRAKLNLQKNLSHYYQKIQS